MIAPSSGGVPPKEARSRAAGRVRCQMTFCDLGEVVDLSAKGARVRSRRRLRLEAGQPISLTIDGLDGPIEVRGKVAWARRAGFFKHEVGVEFDELGTGVSRALAALARTVTLNDSLLRLRKSA